MINSETESVDLIVVSTTLDNHDQARVIARTLVADGLVACAQLSVIDSCYRWNGELEEASEWRLVLKTTRDRYPAVEAAIRARHPYQLPAIFAVPVVEASDDYRRWVEASVTPR